MEIIPLCIETVPEEIKANIKREINETEENVKNGLQSLREFLKRENIPSKTDDDFLLLFLRAQKFNIKKSQDKLRRYCCMRQNLRELFEDIDLDKIRGVLDRQMIGMLPYRDKKGRAVIFTRAGAYDPKEVDLNDAARCMLHLVHFGLSFPMTSMLGMTYIAEARVNSWTHNYPLFKEIFSHLSTVLAIPCRFQRLDTINEHSLLHHLYTAVKPLLPHKFTKRIFMRGKNVELLRENYHPSFLPHEFGGTMGPLSNESYREKFLEFVQKTKSDCDFFRD